MLVKKTFIYAACSLACTLALSVNAMAASFVDSGPGVDPTHTGGSSEAAYNAGPSDASGPQAAADSVNAGEEALAQKAASAGMQIGDGGVVADDILGVTPVAYYEMGAHLNVPLVDGTTTNANQYLFSAQGFSKLKMDHAGVGRYYYRVYSDNNGWSSWANSKEYTNTNYDGSKVSAIQIRVKGYTATGYDIYYKAVLSDGTVLDWAKNGQTLGTMGTGSYIVALRVVLWNRSQTFTGETTKLMSGRYEGPVNDSNGRVVYSTYDNRPYTGFGFVGNTMYYFVDSQPASGWFYADGYKYFANADGTVATDLEPIIGLPGDYQLKYNKSTRSMYVMAFDVDTQSYCMPYKVFISSCGPDTPIGTYKTYAKYDWNFMHMSEKNEAIYCRYLTRFYGHFLMHSLLYYNAPNTYTLDAVNYNYMDDATSGGCIRLLARDSYWIFKNVPLGTTITTYEDLYNKGPLEKPAIDMVIPRDQNYDPTDPAVYGIENANPVIGNVEA